MRSFALLFAATGVASAAGMLGDYLWANRHNVHTATSWAVFASAAALGGFVAMYLVDGLLDRGANSTSDWCQTIVAGAVGSTLFPVWWVIMRVRRAQRRRPHGDDL